MNEPLNISEAAEILGVSAQTLRRWDDNGTFPAKRDPHNGYRVYERARVEAEARVTTADHDSRRIPSIGLFVGRRSELSELGALLDAGERLITLTGVGGVGKTALIRAFAEHDERREVVFCSLKSARDVHDMWSKVASKLRSPDEPTSAPPGPLDHVGCLLEEDSPLIVLDGVEHLLDKLAPDLGRLLAQVDSAQFVVTSRRPMELAEEFVLHIGPLSLSPPEGISASCPAVELFIERARRYAGRQISEAEYASVAELVARLDSIPLAIELAAAQLAGSSLTEQLAQSSADSLQASFRDTEIGHRSMAAALERSWNLLTRAEQRVFAQLSIFADSWTAEQAEQVVDLEPDEEIDAVHLSLIRQSLLTAAEGRDGRQHYSMYRVVADYAAGRLAEHPDLHTTAQQRHAEYFGRWCARWRGGGDWRAIPVAGLDEVVDDLHLAADTLEDVSSPPVARWLAETLLTLGAISLNRGGYGSLLDRLARVLPKLEASHCGRGRFAQLWRLRAELLAATEQHDQAVEAISRAADAIDEPCPTGILLTLAKMQMRVDRLDAAANTCRRAIEHSDRERGPLHIGALGMLGAVELGRGRPERAIRAFGRALDACAPGQDFELRAELLGSLGNIHQDQGRLALARDYYERSIQASRQGQDRHLEAIFVGYLGTLAHEEEQMGQAEQCYRQAVAMLEELDSLRFVRLFRAALGALLAEAGDLEQARQCFKGPTSGSASSAADVDKKACGLHRAHLDVAHLSHALQMKDTVRAEQLAHTIRRRIDSASQLEGDNADDLRLALRLVERRFLPLESRALGNWDVQVGRDATWFELATGGRIDLSSRMTLQRILNVLVEHHGSGEVAAVPAQRLFEVGWPDERATPESTLHRVRQAVFELREFGLREHLVTEQEGYRLHADTHIEQG